jgi:hypothetical protein
MSSDVTSGSKKVKFDGQSVVLKSSKISRSSGDEAGVTGGVVSGVNMGKAQFLNYSFDVKVEGKNVCRLGDPTSQNMSSMNTAGFFHIQAPAMASAGEAKTVEEACERVTKAAKKQESATAATKFQGSGILERHQNAIQRYVDKKKEWMFYFRKTNPLCKPWIHDNHAPKPHSCTAGKTIKPDKVPEVHRWLRGHPDSPEWDKCGGNAEAVLGVVMSTAPPAERGRPLLGSGKFKKKWMTGDYDLMDVIRTHAQCERPADEEAFGQLKHEMNKAMGWPGIQHGPQSMWDTTKDDEFKGEEDFNVGSILNDWIKKDRDEAAADIPARNIAPGRDPLPMVDNQLTVIAPGAGASLENHEDFWDALACCGCRSDDETES